MLSCLEGIDESIPVVTQAAGNARPKTAGSRAGHQRTQEDASTTGAEGADKEVSAIGDTSRGHDVSGRVFPKAR